MGDRHARVAGLLAAALGALGLVTIAPATYARTSTTDFTMISMNLLGASHTLSSTTYATGAVRMKGQVALIERYGASVVGFQEMQATQMAAFESLTAGAYDLYPGTSLRTLDGENSIAWRTDTWTLVSASTVDIPYFDGNVRHMPVVELQNNTTGLLAYFANFHNPATNRNHPDQDAWRRRAIRDEVALAVSLHATGVPVMFTGDMNERRRVFCPMVSGAPMKAARGGRYVNGVCYPDDPWYVDWIFGNRRITFGPYVEDTTPLTKHLSDHPAIVSGVSLDPTKFPRAVAPPPPPPSPTPSPTG